MTDLPATVGYITVVAKGLLGIADSTDGSTQPDGVPLVARVEFVASNTRPVVAIGETPQVIIPLAKITCDLDASGNLRPPNDGINTGADASGSLRLVAPDGPGIDYTGWQWRATFTPGAGQTSWQAFSVSFGGSNGATIDLGQMLSLAPVPDTPSQGAALTALAARLGGPVSTDGSYGLPAPSGSGLEFVITATGLQDIRMNGVSL